MAERKAKVIACDPAQGGDSSTWSIGDDLGLIRLESIKTPDTTVIVSRTVELIREFGVDPRDVIFDAGGGGKQHADRLRSMGYKVRVVAFGESATPIKKRSLTTFDEKREGEEEQYIYKNRRAEMYGILRLRMDPHGQPPPGYPETRPGFAIPGEYQELYRQLAVIPLWYDTEGRLELPSKNKTAYSKQSNKPTLTEIIGHSPDEADSLAMLVYALHKKATRFKIRAA
jgi:hypothetical protein